MSTKEAITHDNHYVPQFYLKYWSNNGNTIHSYNGILRHKSGLGWQTKPIKSTACLQDYYTDEIDGVDDDKVESLFEKSENKTRPIFEQIKSTGFISDSEMSTLIDYTIIQIARTPAFYKFSNSITESMFDQLFRNLVQNLGTEGAHPSVERVEHPVTLACTCVNAGEYSRILSLEEFLEVGGYCLQQLCVFCVGEAEAVGRVGERYLHANRVFGLRAEFSHICKGGHNYGVAVVVGGRSGDYVVLFCHGS